MDMQTLGHAPVWRREAWATPMSSVSDLDPGSWAPAPGSGDVKDEQMDHKTAVRYYDHEMAYLVLVEQEMHTWTSAVPA